MLQEAVPDKSGIGKADGPTPPRGIAREGDISRRGRRIDIAEKSAG